MSRLSKLIDDLCPNGVEYRKLGDFATISRGGNLQKKDFCEEGVPCIHYGQIYTKYGLFTDHALTFISKATAGKQKMADPNDIVMAVTSENVDDVCKCVVWLGNDKVAVSGHTAIIHHNQDAKYLAYYFHSTMFAVQKTKLAHGTKVIEVTPDKLKSVSIPVPPLEVQREIVRVLDSFTLLTAELTAELTARKKQYEYYRYQLLNGIDNCRIVQLGEVCDVYTGGEPPKDCIKGEISDGEHPYAVWGNGKEIYGYSGTYKINKDAVVISSIGANTGAVYFRKAFFTPIIRLKVVVPKTDDLDMRFLFHALSATEIKSKSSSVPNMNANEIKKIKIHLPSIDEQRRIAEILDRFDALCSDMTDGIPAEIEARQKQYEYYRDLILNFRKCGDAV